MKRERTPEIPAAIANMGIAPMVRSNGELQLPTSWVDGEPVYEVMRRPVPRRPVGEVLPPDRGGINMGALGAWKDRLPAGWGGPVASHEPPASNPATCCHNRRRFVTYWTCMDCKERLP